ncbi:MAG: hypothetical protein ACYCR3_10975 [Acidithiobacillus sp.]
MIIYGYDITLSDATVLLALATAVSVFFTAKAASHTKRLADHNKELVEQSERHHMDDERPIIVIDSDINLELYENRAIIRIPREDEAYYSQMIKNNYAIFIIKASLKNIGRGTALNPKMVIRFENTSTKEIEADFPPLASGASLPLGAIDFCITTFDSAFLDQDNKFKTNEYQLAPGQSWEIFIGYHDIYGNAFYSRHPKNPQERWTSLGKGTIPPGKSKEEIARELELITMSSQSYSGRPYD